MLFVCSFYLLLQGTKKFNELVSGSEILVNRNNRVRNLTYYKVQGEKIITFIFLTLCNSKGTRSSRI